MKRFKSFLTEKSVKKRAEGGIDPIKTWKDDVRAKLQQGLQGGTADHPTFMPGGMTAGTGRLAAALRWGKDIVAGMPGGSHSELAPYAAEKGTPTEMGFVRKPTGSTEVGPHPGAFFSRQQATRIGNKHPELKNDPTPENPKYPSQSYDFKPESEGGKKSVKQADAPPTGGSGYSSSGSAEGGSSIHKKSSFKVDPDEMPDTAGPARKLARNLIPGLGSFDAGQRHAYTQMGGPQGGWAGGFAGSLLSSTPPNYYRNRPNPNSLTGAFQSNEPEHLNPEKRSQAPKDTPKLDSIAAGTSSTPPQTTQKTSPFNEIDRIRSHYSQAQNPDVKPWNLSPSIPEHPQPQASFQKSPEKYLQPEGGAPTHTNPGNKQKGAWGNMPVSSVLAEPKENPSLNPFSKDFEPYASQVAHQYLKMDQMSRDMLQQRAQMAPEGGKKRAEGGDGSVLGQDPAMLLAKAGARYEPSPDARQSSNIEDRVPRYSSDRQKQLSNFTGGIGTNPHPQILSTDPMDRLPPWKADQSNKPSQDFQSTPPASSRPSTLSTIQQTAQKRQIMTAFQKNFPNAPKFEGGKKRAEGGPSPAYGVSPSGQLGGGGSSPELSYGGKSNLGGPRGPLQMNPPAQMNPQLGVSPPFLSSNKLNAEGGKKRAEGGDASAQMAQKRLGVEMGFDKDPLKQRLPMPPLSQSMTPSTKGNILPSSGLQQPVMKPSQTPSYAGSTQPFTADKPIQPNPEKNLSLAPDIATKISAEGGKKKSRSQEHGGMLFYGPQEK